MKEQKKKSLPHCSNAAYNKLDVLVQLEEWRGKYYSLSQFRVRLDGRWQGSRRTCIDFNRGDISTAQNTEKNPDASLSKVVWPDGIEARSSTTHHSVRCPQKVAAIVLSVVLAQGQSRPLERYAGCWTEEHSRFPDGLCSAQEGAASCSNCWCPPGWCVGCLDSQWSYATHDEGAHYIFKFKIKPHPTFPR